jgi:hypothetical protein
MSDLAIYGQKCRRPGRDIVNTGLAGETDAYAFARVTREIDIKSG